MYLCVRVRGMCVCVCVRGMCVCKREEGISAGIDFAQRYLPSSLLVWSSDGRLAAI